ncbi:MAG: AraC family transcriptional regulator [Microbacterium sp.]
MTTLDESVVSTGFDAVEARMREQYGKVQLTESDTAMHERSVITPEFFLNRIRFTGSFAVTAELPMLTTVISSGRYGWSAGEEEGDARAQPFLIRPDSVVHASCGNAKMVAMSFDAPSLEQMARSFYADDRLTVRFDSSGPVDEAASALYRRLLVGSLAHMPLLAESDLLRASLYRMMVAGLLECFALHGDPVHRRDSVRSRQKGYRRARAYIDDHAADPITVVEVAAASSLSVPQLDDAVRSHSTTGTDAAGELRRVRLAGAHRDLLAGDPTAGTSVREIALRWGYAPDNFARAYRAAYGCSPRETLGR